jgi:hypothetical protein
MLFSLSPTGWGVSCIPIDKPAQEVKLEQMLMPYKKTQWLKIFRFSLECDVLEQKKTPEVCHLMTFFVGCQFFQAGLMGIHSCTHKGVFQVQRLL